MFTASPTRYFGISGPKFCRWGYYPLHLCLWLLPSFAEWVCYSVIQLSTNETENSSELRVKLISMFVSGHPCPIIRVRVIFLHILFCKTIQPIYRHKMNCASLIYVIIMMEILPAIHVHAAIHAFINSGHGAFSRIVVWSSRPWLLMSPKLEASSIFRLFQNMKKVRVLLRFLPPMVLEFQLSISTGIWNILCNMRYRLDVIGSRYFNIAMVVNCLDTKIHFQCAFPPAECKDIPLLLFSEKMEFSIRLVTSREQAEAPIMDIRF